MIEIESEVFKTAREAARKRHPKIYITDVYSRVPPRFPCAYIEQRDSRNVVSTQDSDSNENHDFLMYEVDVYSNSQSGRKAEAKEIMNDINEAMLDMGFTRTMLQPVPNLDDATIYRLTARYTAVVGTDKNIYGR